MIVKNTYGSSVAFSTKQYGRIPKHEFTGSALQRQKPVKKKDTKAKKKESKGKVTKERTLSPRSKRKIRKKITCFARCYKRLSFVTLTFLNKVSDEQAINLLRKFVDNAKKRSDDFQYVWVAERQTKNDVFEGNVHFHMITNKYWKIDKWWNYWIDLQEKNGIKARDKDYRPSSAFDVRQLNSKNIRSIASYVTKYVTKNDSSFKCQVWNCSKRISELYTDFYTTTEFTDQFKKMGAVLKEIEIKDQNKHPFLNIKMINLNRQTLPMYKRLDDKNQKILSDSILK
ncbi:rolling circle replication-associated protein [Winogradskyella sediminis]|uniref:rolling circle replication-associated protein n=1 Tax=Winogradskyella sediminis TaxID=1382466 RepID=UPI000E286B02|nr:hypothetical protein [Winogradskyella sediminis]REG89378.1 hypothetical protein C8N41_101619 [Winogradskyella sediminis]